MKIGKYWTLFMEVLAALRKFDEPHKKRVKKAFDGVRKPARRRNIR